MQHNFSFSPIVAAFGILASLAGTAPALTNTNATARSSGPLISGLSAAGTSAFDTTPREANQSPGTIVSPSIRGSGGSLLVPPPGDCHGLPVAPALCNPFNRRVPGSLLLWPEFDNRMGALTLLTVTNVSDVFTGVNPNLPTITVDLRFVDKTTCAAQATGLTTPLLTPTDTFSLISSLATTGGMHGFVYGFAKDGNGVPRVFNHLIGHVLILNSLESVNYSFNAAAFGGMGMDGTTTDDNGNNFLELNGVPGTPDPIANGTGEYAAAPMSVTIPRFLGQEPSPSNMFNGRLILINLTHQVAVVDTVVRLQGFNDNHVPFGNPAFHLPGMTCWADPNLRDITAGSLETALEVNDAANEIFGMPEKEAGWFCVDGISSTPIPGTAVQNPAIYAAWVEKAGDCSASDLPFELCSRPISGLLGLPR